MIGKPKGPPDVRDAADMLIRAAQQGCVQRGLDPTKLEQRHLTFHIEPTISSGFVMRVTHPDAQRYFELEVLVESIQ